MAVTPQWGDHLYDLVFKANQIIQPLVPSNLYMQPQLGMHLYDLVQLLDKNIANIDTSGGGSSPQIVTAPSGINDFSTLPGGVAPTSGVYFAPRDQITLWTIEGGDTQWTVIDKNSP